MALIESFVAEKDRALADEFLAHGYVVRPVDDRAALDEMRREIVGLVCDHLKVARPQDPQEFLDHIERIVPVAKLNELRLAVYRAMNAKP